MSPKVKWPDQTDDGIVFPRRRRLRLQRLSASGTE